MAETLPPFVRVSTPNGHFTVPSAIAARAGSSWRVLKQDALDKFGHPLPPKPRVDLVAATPTTEPETASGDTSKE